MDGLRIAVLGPFDVQVDGTPADLGGPKQRAVLGVLTALSPHAVPVERLVDEIWGEAGPANPLRSLQVYVSALRASLGRYGDRLATEGRAYRLHLEPEELDVDRFRRLVSAAAADHDADAAVDRVDEALALWRGEAWQDLRDLPLTTPLAVALEEERLAATAIRARALLSLGRHRELVPWLEPLVRDHPLHEELRGHLMLALHRSDRQADALAVYAEGRTVKADETGLDPGVDLQRLQQRILADDPALRVEDVELRGRRHLPAQLTRLVGRESEVADAVALLRDPARRLVTITGPGGIGKTRVGLEVAHRLAADHPDGVWFVALDAIRDPRLVPQAIADTLGVEEAGGDVAAPLREHLAARRLLLLLDNFEQVEDAAPAVAELLAAAPGLRVVVTSRVRLRVYGEHVVDLDPLTTAEAVSLFVERARSVDRRFDASRTAPIAAVCEQLDRLPLALELVAARVDEVPVDAVAEQLAQRRALDLATDGPRDRGARQRTLRGAIGWSVGLLPASPRSVFARLSVFAGGFTAEAAAAVATAGPEELGVLERASLVRRDEDGRYRLLETVREYAAELLGDDANAVRDSHAAWFLGLADQSVGGMRGPDHAAWRQRLGVERANCRIAMGRLAETADADEPAGVRLLQMAAALGLFWYRTAPGSADVEWLSRALDLAPDAPPDARGRAHYALAICRGEQGRAEDALAYSRRAWELLRDGPDPVWASRALNTLAGITRDHGDAETAAKLMDQSIALRRSLPDGNLSLAIPLSNRAIAALDLRDFDTARRCMEECLALEQDDELEVALAQAVLASVEVDAGELDRAAELLRTCVPVLAEYGQDYRLIESLDTSAGLAAARGDAALAVTLLTAADRVMAEQHATIVPADAALRERRTGAAIAALDAETRAAAERLGADLDLMAAVALARQRLC